MVDTELWGQIKLPEWNLDKFYALFNVIKGDTATKWDRDDFAMMLMYQVSLIIRSKGSQRGWLRTFSQHKIEPSEAAAIVVKRLAEKIPKLNMKFPCPKVLITQTRTTIERELISVKRSHTRITAIKTTQSPEDFDHKDNTHCAPSLKALEATIELAEDEVCGNHKWRHRAYKYMAASLLRGTLIPTIDELPKLLSGKIGVDGHSHIAFYLTRIVARHALDLTAQTA